MDFLNPDDEARKATLEYCDVQALFQFHRFQRERQSDVVMPEKPRERCARLAALYPNVSFRPSEKSQFIAQVKSKACGALIEHLGFIHHGISYLTTTLSFNYDSVQVAFVLTVSASSRRKRGTNSSTTSLTWCKSGRNARKTNTPSTMRWTNTSANTSGRIWKTHSLSRERRIARFTLNLGRKKNSNGY